MSAPSPSAPARRGYLDWLRGLAVLVMIEAHLLDSWTRYEDRGSDVYRMAMIAGGFGAPLFLFLAGVAVPLSAASKLRRTGDPTAASRAVVRRGLEVFGLAFLFRLQACIVSWGSWRSLLKVDILNIMGPSIMAAAAVWGWLRTNRARCFGFAAATVAMAFLTPPIRATPLLARLPDPLEGYLRPIPGLTNFVLFPWAGFVFAGAVCGTLLSGILAGPAERKIILRIALAGCAMALAAHAASFLPSPYERSDFWTSSPSYFFLRTGILVALIGAAFAWEHRPWNGGRFSPLQQMGRSSLFIYWIHIELIYGLMVRPLHKSVSFPVAAFSIPFFAALMLLLSILKEKLMRRYW
jgi:uncharacterized membrane protein